MKRWPRRVVALLVLVGSSCSSSCPKGDAGSAPAAERTQPKLVPSLRVESTPPWPGAPIGLFGEEFALCAYRHEAPIACVGRLYWKLENDVGSAVVVRNTGRPVALVGWQPDRFASGGTDFAYIRDGRLYTWFNEELPSRVPTKDRIADVSGGAGSCYVTDGGEVFCEPRAICDEDASAGVFEVVGPMPPTLSVSVGVGIACAVASGGAVYCWGRLDADRSRCTPAPKKVEPLGPAVSVVAGYGKACALLPAGEAWCWGEDLYGEGIHREMAGLFVEDPARIPVTEALVDLEGHGFGFVGLTDAGNVWAWGASQPSEVTLPQPAIDIFAGSQSCALLRNHQIRCFSPVSHQVEEGLDFEHDDAWMYADKYVWVEDG